MKGLRLAAFLAALSLLLPLAGCAPHPAVTVDLFIFMGQSNMSGQGNAEEAVICAEGHGYEYRAVSDPARLHPLKEPFGVRENSPGLTDEDAEALTSKKGGLVSAFCEYYYQQTGVPIVAVSASKGGTGSGEWVPGEPLFEEAAMRLDRARDFLAQSTEYSVRNTAMVWLQGEYDAGKQTPEETYLSNTRAVIDGMKTHGAEICFFIQIGSYMESVSAKHHANYIKMRETQKKFCEEYEGAVLVSVKLADMPESLMHKNNHYVQEAYNIVGKDAGINAAYYYDTGLPPVCEPYHPGEICDLTP